MNAVNVTIDPKLCKATVNIGDLPQCDLISSINWGDGFTNSGPFISGAMPMHTYSGSGTYIISWLALEYNYSFTPPKICFEKIFRDTISLKCDSCECAGFSPLSFFNTNWPTANLPVKCGKSYQLPCLKPGQNPIFYFHGNMNCNKDSCTSKDVTWQIVAMPLGNIIASGSSTLYPLLGGAHFDITLNQTWFNPNVLYMLTITGQCGTKNCSCKVNFRFAECPCPCDYLLTDVSKGFSVSGNNLSCIRKFKPLGLCTKDIVSWTVTGPGTPIFVPNPTSGNGVTTVSFPPPGGVYYICMSVTRINPYNGIPCNSKEYCQKVIVKCKQFPSDPTRYFNTCQSTTIKNGDFDSGLVVGQLGLEGRVSNWNLFSNSGDGSVFVDDSSGAYDDGHLILVGGLENFAGVYQKLDSSVIKTDSFTIFDYAIKNYSEDELPNGTVLEFRLQESLNFNSPFEILAKQKIDSTIKGWSSRSFSKKGLSTSVDYKYLVICAQNDDIELRSAIGIDNIEACISTTELVNTKDEIDYRNIRIYPNPTAGTFIIQLNAAVRNGLSYQIIDVTGRSLLDKSEIVKSETQSVDVSNLSSGLYFIQFISNGKLLIVKKLIKQ